MQSDRRSSTMVVSAMQGGGRPCKVVGAHPRWSSLPYTVAGDHARWSAFIHDGRVGHARRMECEEVASLVSGETEHCRELPSFLVSCLFPRMGDQSGDEEPGGVMNVCEGLGGEPNESSEHGQVGVEDLDPLQALRLGLELSVSLP
ncbi:unnamed protein product [Prunus armeniaca]|uniref:Uncharacterized protein n=1 Tax=Prunus armeniaca TaxID=36596 RepID=A0A6J5U1G7_PRUAR|nr:unnamed protein product [Prunus armeniaca]